MVENILSPAEMESLLSAMEAGTSPPARTPTAKGSVVNSPHARDAFARNTVARDPVPRDMATAHEVRASESLGKERMRVLQTLHEGFGRNFGTALSGLLRCSVGVKLNRVDQLTYREFIASLENPTCFNVLTAEPLEGNLILDINPATLYPIIDRLLGGGRDAGPPARRPLTEIELRLVARITSLFLEELRRAWKEVLDLRLSVVRVESNPRLIEIMRPGDMLALIRFELTLGEVRGMMVLGVPFDALERMGRELSSNRSIQNGRPAANPRNPAQNGHYRKQGALVELVTQLAQTRITTQDLIGLQVGDIITTDKNHRDPLVVSIDGVAKFRVRPGAFQGRKAIQIEDTIEMPPPPEK